MSLRAGLQTFLQTEDGQKVQEAICANEGYPESVGDPFTSKMRPNPQTREEFAVDRIVDFLTQHYVKYKSDGHEDAGKQVITDATNEMKGL